jgi:hypothetical protein
MFDELCLCSLYEKVYAVFMDDILIYRQPLKEHVKHIRLVFQVLQEHKLFIKFKKCAFTQTHINYPGHIISDKGVATDPTKTEVMLQ